MTITSIRFSIETSIKRESILRPFWRWRSQIFARTNPGLLLLDRRQKQLSLEHGGTADDDGCSRHEPADNLDLLVGLEAGGDVDPSKGRGFLADEDEFCSFVADNRVGGDRKDLFGRAE